MTVPFASLHQRRHDLELRLDGDAYAWAWTPNVEGDNRLAVDLLPELAEWCHLGRGRPRSDATWVDGGGPTVLVTVDLGTAGTATIGGAAISEEAVTELASSGFLAAIRIGMEADRDANDPDAGAGPAATD